MIFDNSQSKSGIEFLLVAPRHSLLCFPAVEHVRNEINFAIREKESKYIVLDCRNVQELDFTAAKGIGSLKKELADRHIHFVLLGPSDEVKLVLKGSLKGHNVQQVDNEQELDITLQEFNGTNKLELREVIAPLLVQKDADGDIGIAKPESLRREF